MPRLKRTVSASTLPSIQYGSYLDTDYRLGAPHTYAVRRVASVASLPTVQKPYLGWKYTGTPSDRFCRDWTLWDANVRCDVDRGLSGIGGSRYVYQNQPRSLWTYYPTLLELADPPRPTPISRPWLERPVTFPYRSSWVRESLDTDRSFQRYRQRLIGLDVYLQQYWLTPNTWEHRFASYLRPFLPPITFNTAPRHYRFGPEYR